MKLEKPPQESLSVLLLLCRPAWYTHVIFHHPTLLGFAVGFPGGSVVKNTPANAGDTGDAHLIPGSVRSTHSSIFKIDIFIGCTGSLLLRRLFL